MLLQGFVMLPDAGWREMLNVVPGGRAAGKGLGEADGVHVATKKHKF